MSYMSEIAITAEEIARYADATTLPTFAATVRDAAPDFFELSKPAREIIVRHIASTGRPLAAAVLALEGRL